MSNKVPQIRFNGYSDAWVQRKLGESTQLIKDGTHGTHPDGSYAYLLSAKNLSGNKLVWDSDDRMISEKDYRQIYKNYQLESDDILLSIVGTIGQIAKVPDEIIDKIAFQRSVAIIRPVNEVDSGYLSFALSNQNTKKQLQKMASTSAQSGVYLGDLANVLIQTPSLAEQDKLSKFFTNIDDLIAANQRKLDLLKEQKKGYLQKMFPKNGTKVPELRFAGFADDWEERKLSDMANVKTGFPFKNENFVDDGQYLVITNGNIQNDSAFVDGKVGNRITAVTDEIKEKYTLNYGDILVTMDGTVGRTAKVVEGNQILAQRVGRLVSESTPEFIYQWLNTGKFFTEMTKVSHGGTIKHISLSEIGDYVAYVPTSKDEREKIGSLFLNIDKTITLHQRKLDLLKEQKKGFLQKMFV